jgi:hypothetical protein
VLDVWDAVVGLPQVQQRKDEVLDDVDEEEYQDEPAGIAELAAS